MNTFKRRFYCVRATFRICSRVCLPCKSRKVEEVERVVDIDDDRTDEEREEDDEERGGGEKSRRRRENEGRK